jgi:hypothetical protein
MRVILEAAAKRPIKLFHGAPVKQDVLRLPKFHGGRAADGHAIYMTSHQPEAEDYGEHIHHVEFHAAKTELINMDGELSKQNPTVKKTLKGIAPHLFEKGLKGRYDPVMTGLDVMHHLQKTHGPEQASQVLLSHGIKGGYGESVHGDGKKTKVTKVYTSYHPERDIKVVGHTHNPNAAQANVNKYHKEGPPKEAAPEAQPIVRRPGILTRIKNFFRKPTMEELNEDHGHNPTADYGKIDVKYPEIRERINSDFERYLGPSTITQYVGLEKVRKVLAYYSIFIPGVTFLEGLKGEHRFEVSQFGMKIGAHENGKIVTKDEVDFEIVFRWEQMGGSVSCSARIVKTGEKLNEAVEGAPGKNKGYVDYQKVGEHDVHVKYTHKGKGHYVPTVRVNGKLHRPDTSKFDRKTTASIARVVKTSVSEFREKVKPTKITYQANSSRKKKIYQAYAAKEAGTNVTVKPNRYGASVSYPDNATRHVPSGHVSYDSSNYAHSYRSSGPGKKDNKDWETKKKLKFWKSIKNL